MDLTNLLAALSGGAQGFDAHRTQQRAEERQKQRDLMEMLQMEQSMKFQDAQLANMNADNRRADEVFKQGQQDRLGTQVDAKLSDISPRMGGMPEAGVSAQPGMTVPESLVQQADQIGRGGQIMRDPSPGTPMEPKALTLPGGGSFDATKPVPPAPITTMGADELGPLGAAHRQGSTSENDSYVKSQQGIQSAVEAALLPIKAKAILAQSGGDYTKLSPDEAALVSKAFPAMANQLFPSKSVHVESSLTGPSGAPLQTTNQGQTWEEIQVGGQPAHRAAPVQGPVEFRPTTGVGPDGKNHNYNYNPRTGRYQDPDTGQVVEGVKPTPTDAQLNKAEGRSTVSRSIGGMEQLGSGIITQVGPLQRADAIKRGTAAVFGNDPKFRTYQDARVALAGNLAVAQQGSRPSDADVKLVWLPLVPDPYADTAESAALKWKMIKINMGLPVEGEPPPGAQVFDALSYGKGHQ